MIKCYITGCGNNANHKDLLGGLWCSDCKKMVIKNGMRSTDFKRHKIKEPSK